MGSHADFENGLEFPPNELSLSIQHALLQVRQCERAGDVERDRASPISKLAEGARASAALR